MDAGTTKYIAVMSAITDFPMFFIYLTINSIDIDSLMNADGSDMILEHQDG